jgi:hypothetical protein
MPPPNTAKEVVVEKEKKTKKVKGDEPRTAAQTTKPNKRVNLTLRDWQEVFSFIDDHPAMSQGEVVDYFKERPDNPLVFSQPTLSRRLDQRTALESRANSHPTALSKSRPRNVKRPDVERALVLWKLSMEEKGETVNGSMLVEKRKWLEEKLQVLIEECMKGYGWVQSFC